MKKIILSILTLSLVVALQAQEKRAPRKRNDVTMRKRMMTDKLKLSEEQKQKAKSMNEEFRKQLAEIRKNEDLTVREWKSRQENLIKKHRESKQNLLTKEQKDRIENSRLQRQKIADINANARREKMKLRLDLNDEQMQMLRKNQMELRDQMRSLRGDWSIDLRQKQEKMRSLMKKRREDMQNLLKEDQKKKLDEMRKMQPRKRKNLS